MQIELWAIMIVVFSVVIFYTVFFEKKEKNTNQFNISSKSKSSLLDLYSVDLTQKAIDGDVDVVIGREKEIDRLMQILSRRSKNNALLLGPPGVGKTAIVEGLARKIAGKNVPASIQGKRIIVLDLPNMIAGTKYRGEFEQRLKALIDQIIAAQRNIILFIDEVHILSQTKGAEGSIDVSDILKPALARGELQAIGATTHDEYEEYFKKDAALNRRFQPIEVDEPNPVYCYKILKGMKYLYENHHQVDIDDNALRDACNLADVYIKDRYLPDKAIDLIDETAARLRLSVVTSVEKIKELETEIHEQRSQIVPRMSSAKRKRIESKIKKIEERIVSLKEKPMQKGEKRPQLNGHEIKKTVAEWMNVSLSKIK